MTFVERSDESCRDMRVSVNSLRRVYIIRRDECLRDRGSSFGVVVLNNKSNVYVWDVFNHMWYSKNVLPFARAMMCAHHHPEASYFQRRAKTHHVGDVAIHFSSYPRKSVSCRRALSRERDFSPTNQLCTFIEEFGKKEHPPQTTNAKTRLRTTL